jgi:hypothetical protein
MHEMYSDAGIERLAPFLEDEQFADMRINLVRIVDGDYLTAAKEVKALEECRFGNHQRRECEENTFHRVLVDLQPTHAHQFFIAVGVNDYGGKARSNM